MRATGRCLAQLHCWRAVRFVEVRGVILAATFALKRKEPFLRIFEYSDGGTVGRSVGETVGLVGWGSIDRDWNQTAGCRPLSLVFVVGMDIREAMAERGHQVKTVGGTEKYGVRERGEHLGRFARELTVQGRPCPKARNIVLGELTDCSLEVGSRPLPLAQAPMEHSHDLRACQIGEINAILGIELRLDTSSLSLRNVILG